MSERLMVAIAEARERRERMMTADGSMPPDTDAGGWGDATGTADDLEQALIEAGERAAAAEAALRASKPPEVLAGTAHPDGLAPALPAAEDPDTVWNRLPLIEPDHDHLRRHGLMPGRDDKGPRAAFDLLRTRLLSTLADRGWCRIAIAAPRRGAGSSWTAANLALAASRVADTRVLLADMDLGAPAVARQFGLPDAPPVTALLAGSITPEAAVRRIRPNLALCAGIAGSRDTAETLQSACAARTLDVLQRRLRPGLMLFDLPPMLDQDDAVALLPRCDALLLVAAAGRTSAAEIRACADMLSPGTAFLGVALNDPPPSGAAR